MSTGNPNTNSVQNQQSSGQNNVTSVSASTTAAVKNPNKDRVTLIVDETPFVVDVKLFGNHQNTLLGRMFSNKNFEMKPNARGEFDVGRGTCLTSSVFRLILVGSA
jgi:hypothetical protein